MTKIMIVDDDQTTITLLRTLLELDGFEVIVVTNGVQVIPTAEQNQPDLILMDYHLADISGVQILEEIRSHASLSQTPVVMTSGLNVRDEVMDAGADEFLVKPFEPGELPDLFNRLTAG